MKFLAWSGAAFGVTKTSLDVISVGIEEATVTQVAQLHEITRQQIYAWRHVLTRKELWSPDVEALFFPWGCPQSVLVHYADEPDLHPDRPHLLIYNWNKPKALTTSRFVASVRSRARAVPSLITSRM